MKEYIKKIICFLIGHDDPVMDYLDFASSKNVYERWKTQWRRCRCCGKELHK